MRRRLAILFAILFGCFAKPSCFGQNGVVNNFAQPIATTVQLPTFGVRFDADGVLELKTFEDPSGELRRAQRAHLNRLRLHGDLAKRNPARKLSLIRLEVALRRRIDEGKLPDEELVHLAGLTQIDSAFCDPDNGEIILIGPAEPWVEDFAGIARGVHSGTPILRLDDLIVALRAYGPDADHPFVGCTISPQADGLARFREFQRQIPRLVRSHKRNELSRTVAQGSIETLGDARVSVFGISPQTRFAQVMIEADYRMKRMAIGVERPPVSITTYADALQTASHGTLERWWLTPAYEGVVRSRDAMAVKFVGQGVSLQTELKHVTDRGVILDSGRQPGRAAKVFATSFTREYAALSKTTAVYARLRQLCDLLIVAAYMRRHGWYESLDWDSGVFVDESKYAVERFPTPTTAPPVVHSFWKRSRMFVPVGGGVSIEADRAVAMAKTASREIDRPKPHTDSDRWWWD